MPSALPGGPSCCGGTWRRRTGRMTRSRLADLVPGEAGADLERPRGLRRGPAPRGGGVSPGHAGRPRGHTDRCPRLLGLYSLQGDLEHAIQVLERGSASVVPPATGTGCEGSWRAWALPMRCGLAEGARCWRRRCAAVPAQAPQSLVYAQLSEVWRLAGRGEEAGQHAHQALDLARQHKERANEALAPHQLGVVHAHADPRCRGGRSPLPAGPGPC